MVKLNKETFASRLKELLQEKNETIYTLAEVVHLSPTTISRYKNGEMAPKIIIVEVMAKYFNVNPTWLMGYSVAKEVVQKKCCTEKMEEQYGKNCCKMLNIYSSLNEKNKDRAINVLTKIFEEQ